MDKNRRNWLTGILSLLGLGAVSGVTKASIPAVLKSKLEGFIVFFINVGQLPAFKALAHVDRIKEQWKKSGNGELIANWQTVWIPTRTEDTHVDFYPINGDKDAEGRLQQIEGYFHEYTDEAFHSGAAVDINDPKVKSRTLDYVLLMLGAPVTKIELDEQQLDLCYTTVIERIKNTGDAANSVYLTENFVKDGAVAYAKMMLGRVRSKFRTYSHGPHDACPVCDGAKLLEEGREDVEKWTEKLEEMM